MNLYIINQVLYDYTSGMCVIAAESEEQCRQIFFERFGHSGDDMDDYDSVATFTVIEGVNHPAGVVDYVRGGG